MPSKPRYELRFAPEVVSHLDSIEKKYHRLIRETINAQLTRQPGTATRNRKSLEQPAPYEATWELRFGPGNRFRAFYEITENEVWILAIGVKKTNRLLVGGEEFEL